MQYDRRAQESELRRTQKIIDYLKKANLPKISMERLQLLEEPITIKDVDR